MSVSLSPLARMQFNQSGIPLAGGKLFTYAAGTTNKLATYTDSTGGTPNTNPVVLDANGQCDLWLSDGVAYKLVLSPSTDTDPPTNAYWTKDNISNNVLPLNPTFNNVTVLGTINKITLTQPATAATITIANNKVFTCLNTLTLTGTDGSSVNFGAGGTVGYTGSPLSQFAATTSAQLLGVISDATGTGKLVFSVDPTFTLSDVTTNNASTSQHGWMPKLSGNAGQFFRGDGTFSSQGVTQPAGDNSTNLATTAYADNSARASVPDYLLLAQGVI